MLKVGIDENLLSLLIFAENFFCPEEKLIALTQLLHFEQDENKKQPHY